MASTSTEKPQSVQRAVICLWISAALTVVATGLQVVGRVSAPGALAEVVTGVVTAGFLAFVALKIARRRGWTRWFFLVLYMLGSFAFAASLVFVPWVFAFMPPVEKGSAILQLGLQTLALGLMFGRTSREWFKGPHVAPAP